MLYQFAQNLDADTKSQLIIKGISDELLENDASHSQNLKDANISQELQKGISRDISQQAQLEFNAVYQKVIGIAKISRKFYQGNTVKMDQFSFNKIIKNLHGNKPITIPPAV